MSLIIHYEHGKLLKAEQSYIRKTPSPVYAAKDGKTFIIGEVFGAAYEDVVNCNWQKNPDALNEFEGALSIVYADKDRCVFASDMNGIETWYTYFKDETFILSDNFWDIIKIVQPEKDDIDEKQLRLSLIMLSIKGKTPIKNLNIVFPMNYGVYNAQENTVEVKKYCDFKYSAEVSDVDVAAEHMDAILNNAMKHIKEKCGNVKYGIGISGGLDSRVIPYYAKKHQMELVGFNVCVPKPHRLFFARGCKNAHQIATAFDIPYFDTKWSPDNAEDKIMDCVRYYPLGIGRNSFKYEPNMPDFDVLLTGASGLVVGSMLPLKIEEFSKDELFKEMSCFFNKNENKRSFFCRATRGLNYIFGTNFVGNKPSNINKLVTSDDMHTVNADMMEFIENGLEKGQTNIEIYEDFFTNVMGFQNRFGAYESIFGLKRSFSIYVPFMLKEVMKWTPELLYDRKVLEKLIIKNIPEVKDIKSELFNPAPDKKSTRINKIMTMLAFLVRGNGAAVDQYWIKKKRVKKKLAKRLDNDCLWFNSFFGIDKNELRETVLGSNEPELMIDVWEFKTLIDCLETKEYMNFDFSEAK